jgi:hypothetical protein
MLEDEYKYYLENETEFLKKFNGKYLIIKDKSLKGDFSTEIDAYNEAIKKFELGTFLVQLCSSNKEANKQVFHSRVIFA